MNKIQIYWDKKSEKEKTVMILSGIGLCLVSLGAYLIWKRGNDLEKFLSENGFEQNRN